MTIDSTWIQSLKNDVPTAFTKHRPFAPKAVFIDGQIKLNSPVLDHTQTWDEYIRRQFLFMIQSYFRKDPSLQTVILAFDNYQYVPTAKGMTQCKRRRYVPVVDFNPRDSLPCTVPKGQDWTAHLSNRAFKAKVIELAIYFVVTHIELAEHQSLIIDYNSHPKRYNHLKNFEVLDELAPLGEADVKFTRYASIYNHLQVDSIDGDSVPIALLHIQKCLSQGIVDQKISILRMTTNTGEEAHTAEVEPPPSKKPKTDPVVVPVDGEAPPPEKKKAKPRTYEYLYVNTVYYVLTQEVFPQCVDRSTLPLIRGKEINLLVALIGLSGTDFTRKLSGVTGRTLYEYLPLLWLQLSHAYDPESNHLRLDSMLNRVIATIYKNKFKNHLKKAPVSTLHGILEALTTNSKLSDRVKSNLQSYDTLQCTVRNINWLMQYWTVEQFPNPVQDQYGFITKKSGAVDYAC